MKTNTKKRETKAKEKQSNAIVKSTIAINNIINPDNLVKNESYKTTEFKKVGNAHFMDLFTKFSNILFDINSHTIDKQENNNLIETMILLLENKSSIIYKDNNNEELTSVKKVIKKVVEKILNKTQTSKNIEESKPFLKDILKNLNYDDNKVNYVEDLKYQSNNRDLSNHSFDNDYKKITFVPELLLLKSQASGKMHFANPLQFRVDCGEMEYENYQIEECLNSIYQPEFRVEWGGDILYEYCKSN